MFIIYNVYMSKEKLVLSRRAGIYAWKNLLTGDEYIGSTANLVNRKQHHRYHLRRNKHTTPHLQRAWNKYGEAAFEFVVLEFVDALDKLLEREQHYLDTRKPAYNHRTVAESNEGRKWTDDMKKAASAKLKKVWQGKTRNPDSYRRDISETTREQIRQTLKGRGPSETAIEKIRKKMMGQNTGPRSPETIQKIREVRQAQEAAKAALKPPKQPKPPKPPKERKPGHPVSEAAREKIREKLRARYPKGQQVADNRKHR